MNMISAIKDYFIFTIEDKYKNAVELAVVRESYKTELFMGILILLFQFIMILFSIMRSGLMASLRRQIYLSLYIALFIITLLFLILIFFQHKKRYKDVRRHENITFIYYLLLCFWSCFITMLDQHSGTGVTVFSYVIMSVGVFSVIKPIKSILLFTSSFIFLMFLAINLQNNPIFFSYDSSLFSIITNSSFVVLLAMMTAIMLYRYRFLHHYAQIKIQEQYNEILIMNKRLNELAMTDQLTQLGNRRYLENEILSIIESSKITSHLVSGIMIDIDFFKQYNDLHGHLAGDLCLKKIARLIDNYAKNNNGFAVRYGGEEFFVCLKDCKNVFKIAQKLRQDIEDLDLHHDTLKEKKVTVSMGISETYDIITLQQDSFLKQCDIALYFAKSNGRNRIEFYKK